MKTYWVNGAIVPPEKATISITDHGLLYGDGIFEGLRFYEGFVFRLKEHLVRLEQSAKAILLNIPYSREALESAIYDMIKASNEKNGYIRIVLTRGEGDLGLNPNNCKKQNLFMIIDQLKITDPEKTEKGAKVIIASTRRLRADGIDPRIKSLNYLNNIMARMEANHAGADEAILLNSAGNVAEGSADNVFILKDGVLKTPPIHDGALAGITREAVMEAAKSIMIPTFETTLTAYDLYNADELFLTGSGAELIPVCEVNGRSIDTLKKNDFRAIRNAFWSLIEKERQEA